jgi:hypothetical protein
MNNLNITNNWKNKYNILNFRNNHYKKIIYKPKEIRYWRILFRNAWELYNIDEINIYSNPV